MVLIFVHIRLADFRVLGNMICLHIIYTVAVRKSTLAESSNELREGRITMHVFSVMVPWIQVLALGSYFHVCCFFRLQFSKFLIFTAVLLHLF